MADSDIISEDEFVGDPTEIKSLMNSPEFSDAVKRSFQENKCLGNAYYSASANGDLMVEGVLLVIVDGKVDSVREHCWNKSITGSSYYDVTKDYVWTKESFVQKLRDKGISTVSYKYLACIEYPAAEAAIESSTIQFKKKYRMLIDHISSILSMNTASDFTINDEPGE